MANYRRAAELEPNGPADYFNRANAAAALYRWDEAMADLRAIIKAKPDFWQAHYLLGMELMANGKTEEAQREFAMAVHFRPDFAPAHLYLGSTLAAQNQPDQALAEYRTVLQLDPTNSSARQQIQSIESTPRHSP